MVLAATKRILLVAGTVGVAMSGCAQTTVQVERETAMAGRRPAIVLVQRLRGDDARLFINGRH